MSIDRIANMLSSIKNSSMAKRQELDVFYSNECEAVAKALKDRGFLADVRVYKSKDSGFKMMNIKLAYDEYGPKITEAKRVSKPGRRIYKGYEEIHKVLSGLGMIVVSTSRGIMTGEEARNKKLGGEIICQIK